MSVEKIDASFIRSMRLYLDVNLARVLGFIFTFKLEHPSSVECRCTLVEVGLSATVAHELERELKLLGFGVDIETCYNQVDYFLVSWKADVKEDEGR